MGGWTSGTRSTAGSWCATGSLNALTRSRCTSSPGYAPELNPVELLNADIKRHVAQANPANPAGLAAAAAAHLLRIK
jgi:hypothetical protein